MLRIPTAVSLCCTLFSLGGVVGACSSESTTGAGNQGGSGSGTDAGTGSALAGAGGSAASNGGNSAVAGSPGRAGSEATAGSNGTPSTAGSGGSSGACTPGVVTCVDDATAAYCDPTTGQSVSVDCAAEFKEVGIDSMGCVTDETGSGCDGEFSDKECGDGATVFAFCAGFDTNQFLDVYVNCYLNENDLQPVIRCAAPFLGATVETTDCVGAEACLPDAGGAGGAGG